MGGLPILPGTVAFLALSSIAKAGPIHGFQVLRWIKEISEGELLVEEEALYPALHRMEKEGWLASRWAVSEKGRRAKYYEITARGKKALAKETSGWGRYVTAVDRVVAGGSLP